MDISTDVIAIQSLPASVLKLNGASKYEVFKRHGARIPRDRRYA
jgi:hypothetical protein